MTSDDSKNYDNSFTQIGLFKAILKYIIYLNFVIAASACALAAGIANIFNLDNKLHYGLFGFFSTLCVYNGQRLFKAIMGKNTPWLKWVENHKILISVLSILSGLLAGYFFIELLNKLTLAITILIGGAVIISFFYVVRMGKRNIRELPHLKIHSIALTWTVIMVLFPIVNENIYNWEVLILFIPAHYIYFIAIGIPFDIRDLKYDLPTQRTIPQVVGVRKAKMISIVLLIIVSVYLGVFSPYSLLNPLFILVFLTQILLITFTTEKQKSICYATLIDGGIMLLGLSYLCV
jgi:hypothetical protein